MLMLYTGIVDGFISIWELSVTSGSSNARIRIAFELELTMSKSREKIITVRVDEMMYEAVKKKAVSSNMPLSAYVYKLIELSLEGVDRTDLLIRNIHEEVLQLEDMFTLMQGYNSEVFATLLARTTKPLNAEQRRELQDNRKKAVDGLQGYFDKVS